MKQLAYVLAGLLVLSACSESPQRRTAATTERADLTLPDTVGRRDTSVTITRTDQPVSPVEQTAPSDTAPAKIARRVPPKPKPRVRTQPSAVDSGVQAYAPIPPPESTRPAEPTVADMTPTPVQPDTAPQTASGKSRFDSVPAVPIDTGSSPATPADSAPPAEKDTLAVSTPGTTSTSATDTMVASPSATESPNPATSVAARTLASGTQIHAALGDSISSRRDTVGHQVAGHVMENVVGPDGKTLIPAGTPVRFTITRLRAARSKNSQGRLALRADGIALNGQLRPVKAEVRPVPRELRGRGVTAEEVAKVGGGAAAGAVLGRVIGGNTRGAVIGGVAGAAAGTVLATQTSTRDVVVKAKTPVVLVLAEPLVVP
jgi:hypothetical protein